MDNENLSNLTNPNDLVDISLLGYFEGKIGEKYATMAAVAATYATKQEVADVTPDYIDIEDLEPGMKFPKNALLAINGMSYQAKKATTQFPVTVLVQDGHIVYDEDSEGRKALVIEDYTLSEDWKVWGDAGIPRTLDNMTAQQESFMEDEQAEMASFKQEIRNDAAQLIVLAASSIKPGTKITSSGGTEYTAEALLTALADLMDKTIVVNE